MDITHHVMEKIDVTAFSYLIILYDIPNVFNKFLAEHCMPLFQRLH